MASHQVPVAISYKKPGTQPPLFIAGSYSDPQWQPQEMSAAVDADGEFIFRTEILATPGTRIQYKFRLGPGDWWVLNEDAESVTDELGNRNNVVDVPPHGEQCNGRELPRGLSPDLSAPETARTAQTADDATEPLVRIDEPTPDLGAAEGFSVRPQSDAGAWLDVDSFARRSNKGRWGGRDTEEMEEDDWDAGQDRVPLFSHECIGLSDHDGSVGGSDYSPDDKRRSTGYEHEPDDFDLEDPQLEQFPSRIEQISELIHEVEAETEEDETMVEGVPPSAVLGVPRRRTNDVVGEFIAGSPATSPSIPMTRRRLEVPRASMGSVSSEMSSAVSLNSIAEEGDEDDDVDDSQVVMLPSPASRPSAADDKSLTSDDDEGVVLDSTRRDAGISSGLRGPEMAGFPGLQARDPPQEPEPNFPANPGFGIPVIKTGGLIPDPDAGEDATPDPGKGPHGSPRIVVFEAEAPDTNDDHDAAAADQVPVAPPRGPEGNGAGIESRNAANYDGEEATPNGQDHGAETGTRTGTAPPVDAGTLTRRTKQTPEVTVVNANRPESASSVSSGGMEAAKKGSWLRAFFKMFMDWIGGFFGRWFGRRRETVLVAVIAVVVAAGIAGWREGLMSLESLGLGNKGEASHVG